MTESTTPNFAIRFPTAASTGTQFATGISHMASDLDGLVRLKYRSLSSNATASSGDLIVTTVAGVTVTLPAPVANGLVGVVASSLSTGASPTTVSGTNIYGVGLNGAASFLLGTGLASVLLQSDGTNWYLVSGQQDTGWVPLTLTNNGTTHVYTAASGYDVPSARQRADRIDIRGAVLNSGSSATNGWGSIPAGITGPTNTKSWIIDRSASGFGRLDLSATNFNISNSAGETLYLDGLWYTP